MRCTTTQASLHGQPQQDLVPRRVLRASSSPHLHSTVPFEAVWSCLTKNRHLSVFLIPGNQPSDPSPEKGGGFMRVLPLSLAPRPTTCLAPEEPVSRSSHPG